MKMVLLPLPVTDRRLLRSVVGALVFIVSLLALVALASHLLLSRWQSDVSSQVSFVLRAEKMNEAASQLQQLQIRLAEEPAIASIQPVPEETVADLLAPWRANDQADDSNWPLPMVIDVVLKPDAIAHGEDLVGKWQETFPQWQISWHSQWAKQVRQGISVIMGLLVGLVTLIMVMLLLVMIMVARTRLRLQKPQIELLRILGAEDHYIRRQLLRPLMRDIYFGCFYGWIAHILIVAGFLIYVLLMWPIWYGQLLPLAHGFATIPVWPLVGLLFWPIFVMGLCYVTLRQTLSNLLRDLM